MPRTTTHHPQDPQPQPRRASRIVGAPTTAKDVVLGVAVQIARKYLFIDARKKALVYLAVVTTLSILTEFFPPADHYYFVQKHNIFNQYGTKLGWFWTCLLVCPFIWLTAVIHHRSQRKAAGDMARMLVATFLWYACTNG
ncbi:hypothetical protein AAVH_34906 [Aphelenchoides avenae]|nr:hypothetical protein AAVH_34906 [Aphelenchus avenae]